MNNVYYRISVENGFTNTRAVLDYKELGNGHFIGCDFFVTSSRRDRGKAEIVLLLNSKVVGTFNEKAAAKGALLRLIEGAPPKAARIGTEFFDSLLSTLNC